ncbi:MAG: HD domain-containing phosphohydrolase [Gammaproteobacteria bacterium]
MAKLRVIAGPDIGEVFAFHERLILGRNHAVRSEDAVHACLTDLGVSREHLHIYRDGKRFYALDKFSSNGSFVDGRRIKPNRATVIPEMAEIKVGDTVLLFESELASSSGVKISDQQAAPARGDTAAASPSLIIDAQAWLDKLRASGPQANARNLARQIKAITQVSLALGGTTASGQLAEQIIRSLFGVFPNADNIFLFSYDPNSKAITSLAGSSDISRAEEQISNTIVRQVIDNRTAILIDDALGDVQYQNNESVHALSLRSVICAPLIFRQQILGLVYIDSRTNADRFSEEDLEILTGISAQIAIAMKNSDLYRDIENLLEGFVSASVQVIESRDPVTAGHSFRVAFYTESLARAVSRQDSGSLKHISLSDQQMRELRYASLLHDFGKVGVKENILTKENKLFDHEIDNIRMRFEYAKACRERHLYHRMIMDHETRQLGEREIQERLNDLKIELQKDHDRLDAFFAKIVHYNRPNLTHSDMSALLEELYQERFEDLNAANQPLLNEFEFTALKIPKGSLTADERHEIEMHVTHTFNFLNLIPWTEDLSHIPGIAHAHHEKLDGSGYPKGVRARDIPLQSRIMTIADIYDALTAPDRPYKSSVVTEVALDMLRQEAEAGKIDKQLVSIFIESRAYEN